MFIVNDMPDQIDDELVRLLEQLGSAEIGHGLHTRFIGGGIAPLLKGWRVAGTAVTLRLPHADASLLHYAAKIVRPGDIVLVDRGGDAGRACWDGRISLAMKVAGAKAAIVDGPAADVDDIRRFGLPVWSRGLSTGTTEMLGLEGAMNVPITVGGQVVNPGDAILADDHGALALAAGIVRTVVESFVATRRTPAGTHPRQRAGEEFPVTAAALAMSGHEVARVYDRAS